MALLYISFKIGGLYLYILQGATGLLYNFFTFPIN